MVNIEKAEEELKIYSKKYDMNEYKISMKYYHTFRVEKICGEIAVLLGLDEEKINLAKLIGLLHDIARFEQYTTYKTYDDLSSVDHGDLAVEILKGNDYIRKYVETDKYDEIIFKSIKYHNKYAIGNDVSEEEKMFCEIIRDADKLDIFYLKVNDPLEIQKEKIENQVITTEVFEQFMLKETIDRKNLKNNIDRIVVLIAFIYDLNFKESYKIVRDNNYIDGIIDLFNFREQDTREKMELIRKTANDFLKEKLKEE